MALPRLVPGDRRHQAADLPSWLSLPDRGWTNNEVVLNCVCTSMPWWSCQWCTAKIDGSRHVEMRQGSTLSKVFAASCGRGAWIVYWCITSSLRWDVHRWIFYLLKIGKNCITCNYEHSSGGPVMGYIGDVSSLLHHGTPKEEKFPRGIPKMLTSCRIPVLYWLVTAIPSMIIHDPRHSQIFSSRVVPTFE